MQRQRKYVATALVLQVLMVVWEDVAGSVVPFSGLFGMGIPLVLGWLYAVRGAVSRRDAWVSGILIGGVGAAVAITLAILLGDQPAHLLFLGTVASSATGWLGGLLGWLLKTGKETTAAPE